MTYFCSSSSTSPTSHRKHQKSYLIIEDLFEMFDEKFKRTNLLHIKRYTKKSVSSSKLFRQVKIIAYSRSAATQKALISQSSKTSNSKSFRQLMPAEAIRTKSLPLIETTSEKLTVLPYKLPVFSGRLRPISPVLHLGHGHEIGRKSCIQSIEESQRFDQSEVKHYQGGEKPESEKFGSAYGAEASRAPAGQYVGRQAPNTSGISTSHTCRRCFRAFRSNNEMHEHLRGTHLELRHRRRSTERSLLANRRLDQPWRKL